ncbi:hypothetical protein GGR33_001167 [Methylobacterium brachythecii]|uniref:Uncharacterized protein n=1 Tax=Methylobacterium brachythecii TaxID=1176177 RepID=A0A7W6AIS8_9HYPH|nr:hypothetical protein [Methylobacterium brachythecii]MBB3901681.1 hypothetical protein [Methylobacterium brachythecii]GLS43961.1 hypothetical protein GCM10007884_19470 [Methylobacterium brachythecii]
MTEVRAAHLSTDEPLSVRRPPASLADVSLHPFRRGLLFLAALSLPVIGCALADRFHGNASDPAQVAAVLRTPPRSGTAANPSSAMTLRFAPAKFGQSLSTR